MLLHAPQELNIIANKVMKETLWLKVGMTKFDTIH